MNGLLAYVKETPKVEARESRPTVEAHVVDDGDVVSLIFSKADYLSKIAPSSTGKTLGATVTIPKGSVIRYEENGVPLKIELSAGAWFGAKVFRA